MQDLFPSLHPGVSLSLPTPLELLTTVNLPAWVYVLHFFPSFMSFEPEGTNKEKDGGEVELKKSEGPGKRESLKSLPLLRATCDVCVCFSSIRSWMLECVLSVPVVFSKCLTLPAFFVLHFMHSTFSRRRCFRVLSPISLSRAFLPYLVIQIVCKSLDLLWYSLFKANSIHKNWRNKREETKRKKERGECTDKNLGEWREIIIVLPSYRVSYSFFSPYFFGFFVFFHSFPEKVVTGEWVDRSLQVSKRLLN